MNEDIRVNCRRHLADGVKSSLLYTLMACCFAGGDEVAMCYGILSMVGARSYVLVSSLFASPMGINCSQVADILKKELLI